MTNDLMVVEHEKLNEKVKAIPLELLEASAEGLEESGKLGEKDRLLRIKFQEEILRAQNEKKPFYPPNVYKGVVHENTWKRVTDNPTRLAYLLIPIPEIEDKLKVLEEDFLNGLAAIAAAGPFAEEIRVTDYLAAAKVVLSRTAPTKTLIEQKSLQLKLDGSKKDAPLSEEELNKRLEEKIKQFIGDREARLISKN